MAADLERFYSARPDGVRNYLQDLRELILAHDPHITEGLKFGMPFFLYRKKMFCYLWTRKESGQPYFGVVEGQRLFHPELIQEDRARMKILLLDPKKPIPVRTITSILQEAITIYTSGQVKLK
ncbi:MAG: DUF1801 domain-containing protein [Flavobacteriales bacterium]|nr:DUF1801 domain-containing protein [Flavobacteriales bacterium]